ncbi:MAG: prepilin-type N-terminal cleavage/methylation domain-containing protein [Oscillospiraceae bacterium]|jgi:type IV pilus assembly protein PilA|nr:prepilin-type N-terminal cleavage/methylation domain-containing protein [Oscillospiraceae bacterium]
MKKLQRLKSNKGFSLVELLIVIAIMAVLVGILAPQYIRYVERSRQSADIQVVNNIAGAIRTTTLDPVYEDFMPGGAEATIVATWNSNNAAGGIVITIGGSGGNVTEIATSIRAVIGGGGTDATNNGGAVVSRSNSAGLNPIVITYTFDAAGGGTIAVTQAGASTEFQRMLDRI